MENLFCTYSQALVLKELGFDEPCFAYYGLNNVEDKIFFDIDPDDGELTSLNQNQFYHNNLSEIGRISAPLKQQAFKWFRDKGFDFATLEKYKDKGKFYGGYINKPDERFGHSFGSNFKTYEEAETACIDKLIELIKKK